VSKLPDKTKYRPYEPAKWDGLEVMEVSYGGNPAIPPEIKNYSYPADVGAISIGLLDPTAALSIGPLDTTGFTKLPITVKKTGSTAETDPFMVTMYGLNWYVQAKGKGDGSTIGAPLPSIPAALAKIKQAYTDPCCNWPENEKATIVISGITNYYFNINGTDEYPSLYFTVGRKGGTVLDVHEH
jgi:hypothetical protein